MRVNTGKIKLSFILLSFTCLLYGCDKKPEVEQGHYGVKIDVAKDMKNPPIEEMRRNE